MNIKRAFLGLAAVLLLPGLAMAGVSVPGSASFVVDLTFVPPDTGATATASILCSNVIAPNSDEQPNLGDDKKGQFEVDSLSINFASCYVTVATVSVYFTNYSIGAGSDGGSLNGGCFFGPPLHVTQDEEVVAGSFECDVVLTARDVKFTVFKEWDTSDGGGPG
ncbi:MAG: hypothetical protein IIC63_05555, partial [Proteobacteria bacterium]|nr:hypothetical protein [Pseudomonadota bacterium]